MAFQTFKTTREVEAVDIHTMSGMSLEDYRAYVTDGLLWVDHHDVLRSQPAGYPLATNKEQLRALIARLKALEPKLGGN
jgi:hypothetical protein